MNAQLKKTNMDSSTVHESLLCFISLCFPGMFYGSMFKEGT